MKTDLKLLLLLFSSFVIEFTLQIFIPVRLYPDLPELFLWYLLLFYPKKWLLILLQLVLLEAFSLPPAPGFYFLLFLVVAGTLYLGKDLFYIEGRIFWVAYLSAVEIFRWILMDYVFVILNVQWNKSFTFHISYTLLEIITGLFLFVYCDKFTRRIEETELVG